MNKSVVKTGVKHSLLIVGTTLGNHFRQCLIPNFTGIVMHHIKIKTFLLCIKVHACILCTNKRYSNLNFNGLTLFKIVCKVSTYIITCNIPVVTSIQLPNTTGCVPLSLYTHLALHLPVSC